MIMYMIDFNPNWGTRFQDADRHTFGPYSSPEKAEDVCRQIREQMDWSEKTPHLTIVPKRLDSGRSVTIGSGPYKTIHTA